MAIELYQAEKLALIGGACALLTILLLVIVCMVSPHCWCNNHCPCAPKFYDRKFTIRKQRRSSKKKLVHKSAAKDVDNDSAKGTSTEGRGSDSTTADKKCEMMPIITQDMAKNLKYDSFTPKIPEVTITNETVKKTNRVSFPPTPPRSLHVYMKWHPKENSLMVTIDRLCLYRPKRKRGVMIKTELIRSSKSLLSKIPWHRSNEECIGSYETEVREQTAEVKYGETIHVNMSRCEDGGRKLKFTVQSTEGTTVSGTVGYAEIDLSDSSLLELGERKLILQAANKVPKGTAQVSLCYLPTAEKLSVIVLRCRELRTNIPSGEERDIYVKMSLIFKNYALGTRKSHYLKMKGPVVSDTFLDLTHTFDLPRVHLNDVTLMLSFKCSSKEGGGPDTSESGSNNEILDENSDDERMEISLRDATFGSLVIGENVVSELAQEQWRVMLSYPRIPTVYWQSIE